MYLYVEMWKTRRAWLALPYAKRKSWMDRTRAEMQELFRSGVELIGFVSIDEDTLRSAEYEFFGLWRMPNKEVAQRFENFVERSGWHDYFEQVNARGQNLEVNGFLTAHLNFKARRRVSRQQTLSNKHLQPTL